MGDVVNFRVNERALKRAKGKKLKLFITAVPLSLIIAFTAGSVVGGHERVENNKVEQIVEYYGDDSKEVELLDYIDISEELNKLNLYKYNTNDDMLVEYNISDTIKSSEEIKLLIEAYEKSDLSSNNDLVAQNKNLKLILELKKQEELVNRYIYDEGYDIAYSNVSESTKKYLGEVFGIEDYDNIKVKYDFNKGDGSSSVVVTYYKDGKDDYFSKKEYVFNSLFESEIEKEIKTGAKSMNDTNKKYDSNSSDNSKYNKDRNEIIKNALLNTIELEKNITDENLYSGKLSGKMM